MMDEQLKGLTGPKRTSFTAEQTFQKLKTNAKKIDSNRKNAYLITASSLVLIALFLLFIQITPSHSTSAKQTLIQQVEMVDFDTFQSYSEPSPWYKLNKSVFNDESKDIFSSYVEQLPDGDALSFIRNELSYSESSFWLFRKYFLTTFSDGRTATYVTEYYPTIDQYVLYEVNHAASPGTFIPLKDEHIFLLHTDHPTRHLIGQFPWWIWTIKILIVISLFGLYEWLVRKISPFARKSIDRAHPFYKWIAIPIIYFGSLLVVFAASNLLLSHINLIFIFVIATIYFTGRKIHEFRTAYPRSWLEVPLSIFMYVAIAIIFYA